MFVNRFRCDKLQGVFQVTGSGLRMLYPVGEMIPEIIASLSALSLITDSKIENRLPKLVNTNVRTGFKISNRTGL